MIIEGFTYVRNGIRMGYPFLASIQCLLPIVDKIFVVVGDSDDGTRESILALGSDKVEIIDSVWDNQLRDGGSIFRLQSNLGIEALSGDWAIHIQADEVISEKQIYELKRQIERADKIDEVDGLLMPYYHFWGDYQHIRNTRRTHDFEIRAFKTNRNVRSYRDSQGFRIYEPNNADAKGTKLRVLKTDIRIFHYSYTRNPSLMKMKANYFHRFWHSDEWLKANTKATNFDFNEVDKLEYFNGEHPALMASFMAQKDWQFDYDPRKSNMKLKDKVLYWVEKTFGVRPFAYKNYKVVQN